MMAAWCGIGGRHGMRYQLGASADSHRYAAPRKTSTRLGPPRLHFGCETAPASGRSRALRGASRLGVAYASRSTHLLRARDARRLRYAPPPVAHRLARRTASS